MYKHDGQVTFNEHVKNIWNDRCFYMTWLTTNGLDRFWKYRHEFWKTGRKVDRHNCIPRFRHNLQCEGTLHHTTESPCKNLELSCPITNIYILPSFKSMKTIFILFKIVLGWSQQPQSEHCITSQDKSLSSQTTQKHMQKTKKSKCSSNRWNQINK